MLSRKIFCGIGLILLFEPLSIIQGWSPPFRISPLGTGSCVYPAVCVDGEGRIWVTWFNSRHLYSRSCYNDSWSDVILVDSGLTTSSPVVRSSTMCKDTLGRVWVAWEDSNGYEMGHIRLSYFDYRDSVWHSTIPDDRLRGGAPAITCDTLNNIWCCWTGFTTLVDSNFYIMAGCYDGDSWTRFDTLAILPPVMMSQTARITTDISGNIWVCFNAVSGVYTQYFDGSNWSSQEYIGTCDEMAHPTICSDSSGNIWVAWLLDLYHDMDGKLYVRYVDSDTWSEVPYPHFGTNYSPYPNADICSDPQGRIWIGCLEARRYYWDSVRVCAAYYEDENWKDLTILEKVTPNTPVIAYGAERVWLVWSSVKEGNSNIYLSYASTTGINEHGEAKNEEVRLGVYPNPFSQRVAIRYYFHAGYERSLKIYDLSGRLVRTFLIPKQRQSTTKILWDGRDEKGKRVRNGVYFIRLRVGEKVRTKKLVLLH